MTYNILMPESEQQSRRRWWSLVWQRRWWIALATLFILVWWLVPPWLYRRTGTESADKLKAIIDTRTALLAGLIGVGALLTFWLNRRVYEITARTLELTEQGHITERYAKAIEQLGSKELNVRLGGVYALERIAIDSKRDHPTVVQMLSGFVREHRRINGLPASQAGQSRGLLETEELVRETALPTDVQAALTVLGRLPQRPNVARGDLSRAWLIGAQLGGADLSRAQFGGADLSGANLDEANLSHAKLGGAHLSLASLHGAHLSHADLNGADLSHAYLSGADLSHASLSGADLSHARLLRTVLSGARLDGANLSGSQGLTQSALDSTSGDPRTQLPKGLQHPGSWVITVVVPPRTGEGDTG